MENRTQKRLYSQCNSPKPQIRTKAQIQNTTPKSIACIYARSNSAVSDPFFSQIAKAIEQEAFKSNYFIRQSFTAMDIANPDMARQLAQFPVDGIVILGRYEKQLLRFFTQNYKM